MRNDKNRFDEMQKAKRDKIGKQTFYIMFYLLMLDVALHGFGFKWLSYPVNVMVIVLVCTIYHLVSMILGDAYVPPEKRQSKPVLKSIILLTFAVALSAVLAFSLARSHSGNASENNDDYSAIILVAISVVGLLTVGVASIVKKINNKNNDDE